MGILNRRYYDRMDFVFHLECSVMTDTPVFIFLIALMCASFAIAASAALRIKSDKKALLVFLIFASLGLFIGYGLSVQCDSCVIFVKE